MATWTSASKSLVELYSNAEMVKIHVNGGTTFTIHKDLLCAQSKYFRGAFGRSFKEAKEKEMTVDATPEVFAHFVKWVYGGSFEMETGDGSKENWDDAMRGAVEAFIFADKYESTRFRRQVLNQIISHGSKPKYQLLGYDTTLRVFTALPASSGLRKYIKDSFTQLWRPNKASDIGDLLKIPNEDAYEILLESYKLGDGSASKLNIFPGDYCQYHEHKTEEEKMTCEATGKET